MRIVSEVAQQLSVKQKTAKNFIGCFDQIQYVPTEAFISSSKRLQRART